MPSARYRDQNSWEASETAPVIRVISPAGRHRGASSAGRGSSAVVVSRRGVATVVLGSGRDRPPRRRRASVPSGAGEVAFGEGQQGGGLPGRARTYPVAAAPRSECHVELVRGTQDAVSAARCAVNAAASAARHGRNGGRPVAIQDAVSSTEFTGRGAGRSQQLNDGERLEQGVGLSGLAGCDESSQTPEEGDCAHRRQGPVVALISRTRAPSTRNCDATTARPCSAHITWSTQLASCSTTTRPSAPQNQRNAFAENPARIIHSDRTLPTEDAAARPDDLHVLGGEILHRSAITTVDHIQPCFDNGKDPEAHEASVEAATRVLRAPGRRSRWETQCRWGYRLRPEGVVSNRRLACVITRGWSARTEAGARRRGRRLGFGAWWGW